MMLCLQSASILSHRYGEGNISVDAGIGAHERYYGVYGTGAASLSDTNIIRIMRTNPDLSYIVSGGAVSQDC